METGQLAFGSESSRCRQQQGQARWVFENRKGKALFLSEEDQLQDLWRLKREESGSGLGTGLSLDPYAGDASSFGAGGKSCVSGRVKFLEVEADRK